LLISAALIIIRVIHGAIVDNMESWAGMSFEKFMRMAEDRRRWNKLVHTATNPRNEDS